MEKFRDYYSVEFTFVLYLEFKTTRLLVSLYNLRIDLHINVYNIDEYQGHFSVRNSFKTLNIEVN